YFLPSLIESYGLNAIYALGIGVFIGGLVQLFIQVPILIKNGYGPTLDLKVISAHTKKIFNRMGVGMIGIAGNQINLLVSTILATGTIEGAVSWLFYGFRLFQFPVGVLGISLAGSSLVHFSDHWKKGDKEAAKKVFITSYLLSFAIMLPSFVCLYFLAGPIVKLIYERGAFSAHDTLMSAMAMKYYLIGLPFYGLYKICAPIFYALDKPKTTVKISLIGVAINIVFCLLLTPKYGFAILALGTSLVMIFNSICQCVCLTFDLKLRLNDFFNLRFFKILFCSLLCAVYLFFMRDLLLGETLGFWSLLARIFTCAFSMGIIYVLLLALMGEFKFLFKQIKK
ncbi:oligosaccharide flippase family protein, partial [bacterium]|nr:oligosaccharide flippase family protein [bacterium]